jgi:uncharacterized protein YjbI with pentapeptide repeats
MANQQQLDLLKQGITATWNRWRQDYPETRLDLNGVDLSGADLNNANLVEADLSGANLPEANLRGTNVRGANLSCAENLGT